MDFGAFFTMMGEAHLSLQLLFALAVIIGAVVLWKAKWIVLVGGGFAIAIWNSLKKKEK